MPLPDLGQTKLCKTLIATGMCDDPDCRYAHNREELKDMPGGQESPLLQQLMEVEANELAEAAASAAKAATGQQNQQNQLLEQQIRAQLNALQLGGGGAVPMPSPDSQMPMAGGMGGAASSANAAALAAMAAATNQLQAAHDFGSLWHRMQMGGGGSLENQAALFQQIFSLSQMAAQAAALHPATQASPSPSTMQMSSPQPTSTQQARQPVKHGAGASLPGSSYASHRRAEASTPLPAGQVGVTQKYQPPQKRLGNAASAKTGLQSNDNARQDAKGKRPPATTKVVSLASELAGLPDKTQKEPQHDENLHQMQLQLQQQLQEQKQINQQLLRDLSSQQQQTQPEVPVQQPTRQEIPSRRLDAAEPETSAKVELRTLSGNKPRIVVKNTFIEVEPGASPSGDLPRVLPPRCNTWGASLSALGADLEDDEDEEVQDAPRQVLRAGEQPANATIDLCPAKTNSPPPRPAPGGLHCVPENNRLNGVGRQISDCSEASAASGDAPLDHKRYQDTPLDGGNKGFSPISSASNLSTLDELPEDQLDQGVKDATRIEPCEAREAPSPTSKLQQDFGISVKNTFLEIEGEKEVASLRLVQTAAGNLYSMGGLPSVPSFGSLIQEGPMAS